MKEVIYLIGQISHEKEITCLWRQEVREFFNPTKLSNANFEIIDPCDNEWNKSVTNFRGEREADPQGLKVYKLKGSCLMVPKDYSYVLRSTGCIANMNQYDPLKPTIGTLFELAWYYQNPEKCVIGVFEGDPTNDVYCNHPFVKESVDVWCHDYMEAAALLKDYYNRGIN